MKGNASFLRPFFFGERFPFAFFCLPNQRRPRFRLRIERELVRQLAFFRIEPEFYCPQIVVDLSVPKRRITRAENIDPVANVTLGRVIETDKDECLVFGLNVGGAVVKLDELMIQQPFTTNTRLLNLTLTHFSLHAPAAHEIIQKRILQHGRRPLCLSEPKREDHGN